MISACGTEIILDTPTPDMSLENKVVPSSESQEPQLDNEYSDAQIDDVYKYMAEGNFPLARTILDTALEDDPNNPFHKGFAAYAYLMLGHTDQALGLATSIIDSIDEYTATHDEALGIAKAFALLTMGEYERITGNTTNAIAYLEKAISLGPSLSTPYAALGDVYLSLGNVKEAEIWYNVSLDIDPKYSRAIAGKTRSLWHQGRYDDAIEFLDGPLQENPNDPFLLKELGIVLFEAQQYESAEQTFRRGLEVMPGDPLLWVELGNVLDMQDKFTDAEKAYRKAIGLGPNQPQFHYNYAICLFRQGKFEQALAEIFLEEQQFVITIPELYWLKSEILSQLGREKEAAIAFEKYQQMKFGGGE
jgi:tetratricopeptide (TPR) repeat protein